MSRMMSATSPLEQIQRRSGVSVSSRSKTSGKVSKTHARARRTLSAKDRQELKRILREPMDFIDNSAFYDAGAEEQIYQDAPDIQKPDTSWYHPVMDSLTATSKTPKQSTQVLLSAAQERVLFLQFNYARHRVRKVQIELNGHDPAPEQAEEILRWNHKAEQMREQIANTNLALVLAMAKRTRMSEVDFADLVSEGNMALLRAVDKFDCGRGFKFSTYACRAILKAFSRQGMKLSKYRQRFPADFDPKLERSDYHEKRRAAHEEDCAEEVKCIVKDNRANLSTIESVVIHHRFGIDVDNHTPLTLEQVGQIIGVTKERVRQIQNKALDKIRLELEEKFLTRKIEEEEDGIDDIVVADAAAGRG